MVEFLFSFVLFMLTYDNEYETKENKFKIEPRIKLNYNIDTNQSDTASFKLKLKCLLSFCRARGLRKLTCASAAVLVL